MSEAVISNFCELFKLGVSTSRNRRIDIRMNGLNELDRI